MLVCSGFKLGRFPQDPNYEGYTLKNFNTIFALLHNTVWTAPYTYDCTELDNILTWSQKHNKAVILDGVIWRSRFPQWLQNSQFSTEYLKKITLDYVGAVIKYPFYSFDLLSELFNFDGQKTGNFWHSKLGDSYLTDILEYAKEHKGTSKFIYSDFGIKLDKKWEGILEFLKSIKNENLIDAVSIQVHVNVVPGFQKHILANRIKQVQDLGYEIQIPEIVCWENVYFPGGQVLQGRIYHEIIDICLEHEIGVIGFGSSFDAHAWLVEPYNTRPGLWDKDYNPKYFTKEIFQKLGLPLH